MAVTVSYDSTGILRVVDPRLSTKVQFDRVASVSVSGWSAIDEVASKKQSWESVNTSTGAITGSN